MFTDAPRSAPTPSDSADTLRSLYAAQLARALRLEDELKSIRQVAGELQSFALESDRTLNLARLHLRRLKALHDVALQLASAATADEPTAPALALLLDLVPSTSGASYVINGQSSSRTKQTGIPLIDLPENGAFAREEVRWALRADNEGPITSPDRLLLAVPFLVNDAAAGALVLSRPTGPLFTEEDEELAQAVATIVSLVLHTRERERLLEEQALTDGLTGLANYRYFHQQIELEVARAQRLRYPLGLLMADIDHFKRINDEFGHPTGDRALVEVARAMHDAVRRSDVIARVGGEEFAVILPGCDTAQAELVAEKLRLAVSGQKVRIGHRGEEVQLSVSVGGVSIFGGELGADELIARADAAMLQAKRAGRNTTIIAEISTNGLVHSD